MSKIDTFYSATSHGTLETKFMVVTTAELLINKTPAPNGIFFGTRIIYGWYTWKNKPMSHSN